MTVCLIENWEKSRFLLKSEGGDLSRLKHPFRNNTEAPAFAEAQR